MLQPEEFESRDSSCDLGEEMPVTFIYIYIRSTWRMHPRTWIRGVNNHGDRFHPLRIGLWDPFPNGLNGLWLTNGGDPNHLHPLG